MFAIDTNILNREEALEQGCRAVVTFDKKLLGEAGFIEP